MCVCVVVVLAFFLHGMDGAILRSGDGLEWGQLVARYPLGRPIFDPNLTCRSRDVSRW